MRYIVTDRCIACGLCAATCPAVFEMGPHGKAEAKDIDISPAEAPDAEDALESCPVSAIEHA